MQTYDFKLVTLTIGSFNPLNEFEEGGIEFQKDEDLFTKKKGAGGEISRTKITGTGGKFKVRLKQTSQSNKTLNTIYLLDQSGNAGVLPILYKDGNDGTIVSSQNCWINKLPLIVRKEAEDMCEWEIDCDNCFINIGGITL